MKKLVVLIAVLAAGMLIYNYATTGTLSVLPPSLAMSDDERAVQALEERFDDARRQFSQAGRSAGLSGMDTTGDADGALRSVQKIADELAALQQKLPSGPAKDKAETLAASIEDYTRSLR